MFTISVLVDGSTLPVIFQAYDVLVRSRYGIAEYWNQALREIPLEHRIRYF